MLISSSCNVLVCLVQYFNFYFLGMPETEEQNRIRFQVELEFVQCLANPNYIHCKYLCRGYVYNIIKMCNLIWRNLFQAITNLISVLAQRGYFKEQTFINYLRYLQYWREPEYARFLKYPMCLHFLELLQHEAFRRECVSAQVSV